MAAGKRDWRQIGDLSAFGLTIFLSAFLLFQVQPVIGKYILPWFGGGPGVWTTCMLFFQALLLVGYAYAHFTSRGLGLRSQIILQFLLFGVAVALLPITPRDSWKPTPDGKPAAQILLARVPDPQMFGVAELASGRTRRTVSGNVELRAPLPLFVLCLVRLGQTHQRRWAIAGGAAGA